MSTYTRGRQSPRGQYNTAEKRNGNAYTQAQHGRRGDGVDQPFPNKPVSHRRPLNPGKQDSHYPYDLDLKSTITKQPRGQEHHSDDTRKTKDPRKDVRRQPNGELQMAEAIHAKELVLQEKLWSVEEKIRQLIQRDASIRDDRQSEEQRHDRGQAERGYIQTKSRPPEQQSTEAVRRRETIMQEREQEVVKQLRRTQDQRDEDRMRNTHEEERPRWERRGIEGAQSSQSQRKGHEETHQITAHQQASGGMNKSRSENVKEHTRRKGRDEKDNGILGKTSVKTQDGAVKAREREQNTTSMGNKGWTKEKKYKESTGKDVSDDERDMPLMSQQNTSHKAATENHRSAGGKLSEAQPLPPVSHPAHSSRPELGELRQEDSTDAGLQRFPCRICNRKFASGRLQKHVQICKKVKQSNRDVFNSYINRTKGSAIEEFWKTHSKSPEVLKKKNQRPSHMENTKNLHAGQLPAGSSKPKWSK